MLPTNKIITYGSLRVGQYNFKRLKSAKVISENVEIDGFSLYTDNKVYPFAIPDKRGNIICDVLELSQEELDAVASMELCAGYWLGVVCGMLIFVKLGKAKGSKFVGADWINSKLNTSQR